jgi:uncharacterized protein (DUF1778 family)
LTVKRSAQKQKPETTPTTRSRIVRSLHLSVDTDAQIREGARLTGESIAAFIRAAAVHASERAVRSAETVTGGRAA